MNLNLKNEIQKKIYIYSISLIIAILFYLLLSKIDTVLQFFETIFSILLPFLLGFGIAFILNPVVGWLEERLDGFIPKRKTRRTVSSAIVFILTIILLVFLLWILVPALISSISIFTENISVYMNTFEQYLFDYASKFNISYVQVEDFMNSINLLGQFSAYVQEGISRFFSFSYSFISVCFKVIIGLAAAFYLTLDKERLLRMVKRVIYAFLPKDQADFMLLYGQDVKLIFERYIVGNFLDSFIVGLVCWIGMLILQIPYAPVIGLVVGITNLIPVFGPFLGAIPVIFILLLINPMYALIFAVFILILQQVDGNILKPVILGDQLGLSGFWILFAVTIGGSLFGILGMFLGVPIFALIYEGIRDLVNLRLKHQEEIKAHPKQAQDQPDMIEDFTEQIELNHPDLEKENSPEYLSKPEDKSEPPK